MSWDVIVGLFVTSQLLSDVGHLQIVLLLFLPLCVALDNINNNNNHENGSPNDCCYTTKVVCSSFFLVICWFFIGFSSRFAIFVFFFFIFSCFWITFRDVFFLQSGGGCVNIVFDFCAGYINHIFLNFI